jgi:hypothetical protein
MSYYQHNPLIISRFVFVSDDEPTFQITRRANQKTREQTIAAVKNRLRPKRNWPKRPTYKDFRRHFVRTLLL